MLLAVCLATTSGCDGSPPPIPSVATAVPSSDPGLLTAEPIGPRIAFDDLVPRRVTIGDTVIEGDMLDLGTIGDCTSLTGVLPVRNAGDQPLVLGALTTSCQCVQMQAPDDPIVPPGRVVDVVVDYTSCGVDYFGDGRMRHALRLASNDPTSPVSEVGLTVERALDTPTPAREEGGN